jgi:hypothetical protein
MKAIQIVVHFYDRHVRLRGFDKLFYLFDNRFHA